MIKLKIAILISGFVFGLSMVLLIVVQPVTAQAPTSTWAPLFPTSTPQPTNNYDCGEGMPSGWGTYTPEPWWLINCSQCLLTQTQPAGGTATPVTTTTPQPTPTSVLSDHYTLDCSLKSENGGALEDCGVNNQSRQLDITFAGSGINEQNPGLYAYVWVACEDGYSCNPATFQTMIEADWDITWSWQSEFPPPPDIGLSEESHIYWSPNQFFTYYPCYGTPTGCSLQTSHTDLMVNRNTYLGETVWMQHLWTGSPARLGVYTWLVNLSISLGPHLEPTATPGPTAEVGYCGSIGGGGEGGEYATLPVIRVGESSCVSTPGFEIDTSEWPIVGGIIPSISWPSLSVCFAPIDFDQLTFLGITVDLNLMATVMGLVVAMRVFFRIVG